jgi:hypothetical protein
VTEAIGSALLLNNLTHSDTLRPPHSTGITAHFQQRSNMMLCNLCSSIPIDNLPAFPPSYYNLMTGYEHVQVFKPSHHKKRPRGLLGFSHQPDLQSLRSSAVTCELCRLILAPIDLIVDELRDDQRESYYRLIDDYGTPSFDLWLTKRRDVGDGFWALCHSKPGGSVYLLAAIGFCVRDSMNPRCRRYWCGLGNIRERLTVSR